MLNKISASLQTAFAKARQQETNVLTNDEETTYCEICGERVIMTGNGSWDCGCD